MSVLGLTTSRAFSKSAVAQFIRQVANIQKGKRKSRTTNFHGFKYHYSSSSTYIERESVQEHSFNKLSERAKKSGSTFLMAWRNRSPEQVMRITGCDVDVDDTGSKAQVTLPGFTTYDFDRSGNLNFVRLQSKLTSARFLAYHIQSRKTGNTFLEYDVMTRDIYTFMASSKTTVDRDYYKIPDEDVLPELAVKLHLGYVGNASLNSVTELIDKSTGKLYASNTNTVVCVDKTTRKPIPIPDWWKQKYQSYAIGNKRLVCPPLVVPEVKHNYKTTVTWSDIDGYKHTNFSVYIRFCFDAAMDAIHHGKLSRFNEDITNYLTKEMQSLFKGESRAGDELNIACWEDTEDPYTLHFDMTKGGESIFQSTLGFHKPLTM